MGADDVDIKNAVIAGGLLKGLRQLTAGNVPPAWGSGNANSMTLAGLRCQLPRRLCCPAGAAL